MPAPGRGTLVWQRPTEVGTPSDGMVDVTVAGRTHRLPYTGTASTGVAQNLIFPVTVTEQSSPSIVFVGSSPWLDDVDTTNYLDFEPGYITGSPDNDYRAELPAGINLADLAVGDSDNPAQSGGKSTLRVHIWVRNTFTFGWTNSPLIYLRNDARSEYVTTALAVTGPYNTEESDFTEYVLEDTNVDNGSLWSFTNGQSRVSEAGKLWLDVSRNRDGLQQTAIAIERTSVDPGWVLWAGRQGLLINP